MPRKPRNLTPFRDYLPKRAGEEHWFARMVPEAIVLSGPCAYLRITGWTPAKKEAFPYPYGKGPPADLTLHLSVEAAVQLAAVHGLPVREYDLPF